MFPVDTDTRDLHFPLDRSLVPETDTPDEEIENHPFAWPVADSDELVYVTLALSLTEYIRLSAAIDVGSDIAYGQSAIYIWWLWVRRLKLSICQQVIDCIENDAATQVALSKFLEDSGYGSGDGTPDTPSLYDENDLIIDGSLVPGCDNDALFGAVTQLVDFMNTVITDFFESVEGASEGVEKWGAVLEAVPITNVLAIDDLVQFTDQFVENIGQSYAAEYTAQLRDDFRCDLFCLVKDTCEVRFDVWADYFMGLLGEAIVENSFSNAISWFLGGNYSNEEIVYAAHALACQVLAYGSKFLGMDMAYLSKVVTAALNDPDADWQILCTECTNVKTVEFDFTISAGGWVKQEGGDRGVWESGVGWKTEKPTDQMGCIIYKTLPANVEIHSIRMDYQFPAGSWGIFAGLRDDQNSGSGQVVVFNSTGVTTSPNCGYGAIAPAHRDTVVIQLNDGNIDDVGIIKKCIVKYEGDDISGGTASGVDPLCP